MLRDVVVNLLHNLGGRKEVDRYLREYTEGDHRFAVVKVGGGLIENDLDELASALVFMQQVGLSPVVVHGGGPQLTKELADSDIESEWVDGLRVTTPATLLAAQRVFQRTGAVLADAIESCGGRARPLPTGIFRARETSRLELGRVGEVTSVAMEPIERAADHDQIPVLSPVGTTSDGHLVNINADTAARALAERLRPKKIIYLTPTGGILDRGGAVIPAINSARDLEPFVRNGTVSGGMERKLVEIDELLAKLGDHASVSITTPATLARELFTYRGSGTLIRRGAPIRIHRGLDGLDPGRVAGLLERSFGRALKPGYLNTIGDASVYVGGEYTAIAVVRPRPCGDYLDKLGISEQAQGIGLGAGIWQRLREEHPALYWRSRPDNPANSWYLSRADGMHRTPDWLVFWSGIEPDRSRACIDDALSFDPSFCTEPIGQELTHGV